MTKKYYEYNFVELMDALEKGPVAMYVGKNSLTLMEQYIRGYCYGRYVLTGGQEDRDRWDFYYWWKKYYNITDVDNLVGHIIHEFNDDGSKALVEYFRIWNEYKKVKNIKDENNE